MLKKLIPSMLLVVMAVGSLPGCFVSTRGNGRRCAQGFTWNGGACVRERGGRRPPPRDTVIIHDNRR